MGSSATQAYIITDLDGCLALNDHRSALIPQEDKRDDADAWREYVMRCNGDTLNRFVANLLVHFDARGYAIMYCTGRMEYAREVTWQWLRDCHVPSGPVSHRGCDDLRPNWMLKETMLDDLVRIYGALPELAIEDDPETVAMYQRRGVNVLSMATRSSCLSI